MSTNLEDRAGERPRKRESRPQASEAQREKGRQSWRSRARDKKQMRHFFVGRTTSNFFSGGDKIGNASGHQSKVKISGSFWKFHVVVVQINGKEMYKKRVLHVQSYFFAN